jgi:RNA-binding protein 8A
MRMCVCTTIAVEGWVVIATGVHEEAQEDDVYDVFADCGNISQTTLNLDRKTGFVKGYALVEFETYQGASRAIKELEGTELLGKTIHVDWAFKKPPRRRRQRR